MTHRFSRLVRAALALALAAGFAASARPALAAATVDGAGSTWSQIAVDQWRADVARQGIVINFQGVGSTAGRVAYYQGQVDFAVSEIPFQRALTDRTGTASTDEVELAKARPYAYLPIVAGGTAFMYNLNVGGQRVTDLQLSPTTLGGIFSGQITNWNDPKIAADNPQRVLPATRIKPVIRSDGSGTSAQFTAYLASKAPAEYDHLCREAGLPTPCTATSLYPDYPGSGFAAQQFSDGVANFVAAPYNDGSITYVEYGYAKERGFPVASIKNKSGAYAQPTALNVSIALQGAAINADGTQKLSGVYDFADPRTYPVSSYSYMIVPTTTAAPFSAEKGEVLSRFIAYFLCAGQQKAEQLGYSPLPKNLVQVAFDAVRKIPGAAAPPAIESCSNPTITGQFITPAPTTVAPTTTTPGNNGGGGGGGGGDNGGGGGDNGNAPGSATTSTTVPGGGSPGPGSNSGGGGTQTTTPGQDPSSGGQGSQDGGGGNGVPSVVGGDAGQGPVVDAVTGEPLIAAAVSVELTAEPGQGVPAVVYVVIVIALLAAVFVPPVLAARRARVR